MYTRLLILSGCTMASLVLGAGRASALHPIIGHEVELVPELSILTVTGGIAGIHQTYHVEGSLTPIADPDPHDPEEPEAAFLDVNATLRGGGFFGGDGLNDLLRMTDWRGTIVDDAPLTMSFTGRDSQDAPIASIAEFSGIWLQVRGESQPGCCDFFHYSWDLFALQPRGDAHPPYADFDDDGDVDGHDLLGALLGFGKGSGATLLVGDADGDADVDRTDIRVWRATVGTGVATHSVGAAPEPSGLGLALLSTLILGWNWNRNSCKR